MEKHHGSSPCLLDPSWELCVLVQPLLLLGMPELGVREEPEGHLKEEEWPGLWEEVIVSCSNTEDGGNTLRGCLASPGGWLVLHV